MKKVYQKMKAEIIDLSKVSDEALAFAGYINGAAVSAPRKKLSLQKADPLSGMSNDDWLTAGDNLDEFYANRFTRIDLS